MPRQSNHSLRMPALRSPLHECAAVTLGFLVLTCALTWPVVAHLSTRFMGDGYDGYQNVWNMWWVKTALLDLHVNPYFTPYLFHPHGVTLVLHTLNPFNGLLSIPLQLFLPMEAVYNVVILFSFVASGVAMYYLARYVTGSRAASLVAGIVFTFCPYHIAHGMGHMQLIAMEWLPVYALFLLRAIDRGGWRNAAGLCASLVLINACDWYYVVYALMLAALIVAANARRLWEHRDRAIGIGVAHLVYLCAVSPLIYAMIHAQATAEFGGWHNPSTYSADVTSFFIPSGMSTYGKWFFGIWSHWKDLETVEHSNYLGYLVLAITAYAAVRVPAARRWALFALVFLVLALGPFLVVMGHEVRLPIGANGMPVRLPYLLLHKALPVFRMMGIPERFDIMVKFCLALCVAFGLARLVQHARVGQVARHTIIPLAAIIIMLEYLSIPFPMTSVAVPRFYRDLAKDKAVYGVIDIPSEHVYCEITMALATIHHKPMVGGYVSRAPLHEIEYLRATPVLSTVLGSAQKPQSPDFAAEAKRFFAETNIRYIITHDTLRSRLLEDDLRLPVVDSRDGIRAYDCRGETSGSLR